MEKSLNELVEKLKQAAGPNLISIVLYGSAAAGEFHQEFSDLNVIAVVERLGLRELGMLQPAAAWWARKGHPAPLLFTREGLERSADVFAIELLDIKSHRRVLHGEDVFRNLEVPMHQHRLQVERELRINLTRLRQRYLLVAGKRKETLRLMTQSISTFTTLLRHALLALGEKSPRTNRQTIEHIAARLGFDARSFHTILDVRERKLKEGQVDANSTFGGYLEGIMRVVQEID
jgi:predicted nucleotidyltransferase